MPELTAQRRSPTRIFRAFHVRVHDLIRRLETESPPTAPPPDVEALQEPLIAELRGIDVELGEAPGGDPAVNRQILYLLAAHADDLTTRARWAGAAGWRRRSLERQLFGTDTGPTEVLERVDRLLAAPTPENRELARLFLLALGLGFRGRAAYESDGEILVAEVGRRLIGFADPTRRHPAEGRRRVFPQAYRYTAARGEPRLLPSLRPWLLLALGVLLLFALASGPLWEGAVRGVRDVVGASESAVSPRPEETPASSPGAMSPGGGGADESEGESP